MKVLLVRPPAPNKLSFAHILDSEPLELEYLHTGLMQAGFEDMIYDYLCQNKPFGKLIKEYKPDAVAISGYITQENVIKRFCMQAKKYCPGIKTIAGGVHAQINTGVFKQDYIDYISRSESVEAFVNLIRIIDAGLENTENTVSDTEALKPDTSLPAITDINGLCYKDDNGLWHENALLSIDINELPIPDRSFFNRNKKHFRYLDLQEAANIKTSYSCPYNCKFCYCTLLHNGNYRERRLELVIEELKGIESENIVIVDDDFMVNADRLREFIRMVRAEGIKKRYVCYGRADFVAEHPDIVRELADIGFTYFLIGLEAVKDTELKDYNKGTSTEHNAKAVEIINSTPAQCIGLMIIGAGAVKEDFDNLYEWIVRHELLHVTVSIFTPIPGTPLYEEYRDRITSTNIEDWDFLHLVIEPENMSKSRFYACYRKLFMKLYRRARKAGLYSYLDLRHYKRMLSRYLFRKIYLDR